MATLKDRKGLLEGDEQTALDTDTMSQMCYLTPLNIGPSHTKPEAALRQGNAGDWFKESTCQCPRLLVLLAVAVFSHGSPPSKS